MASVSFVLHQTYGNPPFQGGGFCVGAPGDTEAELITHLQRLYGPRLASISTANGEDIPPAPPEPTP